MKLVRFAVRFACLALSASAALAQSPYRLNNLEKEPIPRDEFYRLWRNVALGNCSKAVQQRYESPEACRQQVLARSPGCAAQLATQTPEKVGSFELSGTLARQYLACMMAPEPTPAAGRS